MDKRRIFSAPNFVIVIGSSLFLLWLFIAFKNLVAQSIYSEGGEGGVIFVASAAATFAFCHTKSAFAFFNAHAIQSRIYPTVAFTLALIISVITSVIGWIGPQTSWIDAAIAVIAGMSSAICLLFWTEAFGNAFYYSNKTTAYQFICASPLIACVAFEALLFIQNNVYLPFDVVAIAAILAIATSAVCFNLSKEDICKRIDICASKAAQHVDFSVDPENEGYRKAFRTVCAGIFAGLAVGVITCLQPAETSAMFICAAFLIGVSFAFLLCLIQHVFPAFDEVEKVVFLAACLISLSLVLLSPSQAFFLIYPTAFIMALFFVNQFAILSLSAFEKKIAPFSLFASSYMLMLMGMFFGWGFIRLLDICNVPLSQIIVAAGAIVILFMAITYIVLPYSAIEWSDLFSYANDYERSIKERKPQKDDDIRANWEQRCQHIAQANGLTARETEVFGLLACGRNLDFISSKLVISPNTTKTHIYRIYKKIGVNSHQELISMVETADGEGEAQSTSSTTHNSKISPSELAIPTM